jgi:hypothetical protein
MNKSERIKSQYPDWLPLVDRVQCLVHHVHQILHRPRNTLRHRQDFGHQRHPICRIDCLFFGSKPSSSDEKRL